MRKSQVGIEFLYFVSIALILLLVYLSLSSTYLSFATSKSDYLAAQNLLEQMRNEVNLAGRVEDGYSRTVKLPNNLNGKPYTIFISSKEISINFGGNDYSKVFSTDIVVSGSIQPGAILFIEKINEQVSITVQ